MKPSIPYPAHQSVVPVSSMNPQFEQSTLPRLLEKFWQFLLGKPMAEPEVQVWHHCDQTGAIWWNGYDPSTDQSIHEVSEAEIRRWLERR